MCTSKCPRDLSVVKIKLRISLQILNVSPHYKISPKFVQRQTSYCIQTNGQLCSTGDAKQKEYAKRQENSCVLLVTQNRRTMQASRKQLCSTDDAKQKDYAKRQENSCVLLVTQNRRTMQSVKNTAVFYW